MAYNILQKRAAETAKVELVQGDGAPLLDDDGNVLTVTIYGPGSKRWQQADAERSRKRTQRIEKNRGRISAALEGSTEDEIDFLVAITVSFDGWEYPAPANDDGTPGAFASPRDQFRAAYADDAIGFIRDHVHKEGTNWSAFTQGSKG